MGAGGLRLTGVISATLSEEDLHDEKGLILTVFLGCPLRHVWQDNMSPFGSRPSGKYPRSPDTPGLLLTATLYTGGGGVISTELRINAGDITVQISKPGGNF